MPMPKKYQFKTEEPYGWLSPGLRESLSDTIERITENNRKKEEAKQNRKRAEFKAKQKKRHEVNQNVRKADKRFAENLTDLADEYIGGTIDQAQADIGNIFEPWFDGPIMQSPFAQSLLSGLTPTKWGRMVQDFAGAGADVVSGKPRRPVHSPFDYTAPDMALTGHEDLDRRIDFLANILLPVKSAKVAPKLATSLGEGVTRGAESVARPVKRYGQQLGKRWEKINAPLREEPSRVVELTPEEIAMDEAELRAQEAHRAFIERMETFNAQLREELDEIRSLSNRSRTLSNSTPTNRTPTHTSDIAPIIEHSPQVVNNLEAISNVVPEPSSGLSKEVQEAISKALESNENIPLLDVYTTLKDQGFPSNNRFVKKIKDPFSIDYESAIPDNGISIEVRQNKPATHMDILPHNNQYLGAKRDALSFINEILPNYGTVAADLDAKAPNQLTPLEKGVYLLTGNLPNIMRKNKAYSLDVARFLNRYYKNPEKAAKKGFRVEISPNTIMKGTNSLSRDFYASFQDVIDLAPDVDFTKFEKLTPEQVELWNHKYTKLDYPAIDPKTRTMPYFILRKIPKE